MRSHLILSAVLVALALPASAQEAPAGTMPGAQDLRALRYYIEQDETEAVAAEIRRLQIDFPGWTPPEDLSTLLAAPEAATVPVDAIYAQIAAGEFAAARSQIAATRTQFPDWTPPADMIALLDTGEAQAAFDAAVNAGQLDRAVSLAVGTPALLRCDRINNTWQLAELQAAAGNNAAALAAYGQIVQTCTAAADIIATLEKADAVASVTEITGLLDAARARLPGAAGQIEALRTRLLAGRGIAAETATSAVPAPAAATPAPAPAAAPAPSPAPAPAATAASPAAAAPVQPPAPLPQAAAPAAVAAVQTGGTAYDALPRSGDPRLSRVRSAAQAENFRACAAESLAPRSLDVAYERAWCVYNLDRPLESLALFSAVANGNMGGTVPRDARYGMALSMLELQMTDAASRIAAATDFSRDQRMTIETIILDQRGVRAYDQGDYRQAIIYFDGLAALEGGLRRDLALLRGYAYLNSGNAPAAMAEFQRLNDDLSTPDTRTAINAVRAQMQAQ